MNSLLARLNIACALGFVLSASTFAQWTKIYGSYGGPTNVVMACPDGSGGTELFAGSDHGPFRSTDNGATWTPANSGLDAPVVSLTFNNFGIYAGIRIIFDNHTSFSIERHVFFSSNHGSTWTRLDSTWNAGQTYSPVGLGDNLYVGSDSGLIRTSDNGKTWSSCGDTVGGSLAVQTSSSGDTTIIAQSMYGVRRSIDNGATWQRVLQGGTIFIPPRTYTNRMFTALAAHDSFAFVSNVSEIWRSNDDGASWSAAGHVPWRFNDRVISLAADDSNLYATTGDFVCRSTDQGMSWTWASQGLPRANYQEYYTINSVSIAGSVLYAATVAGVFTSTNHGASWEPRNSGLDVGACGVLAESGDTVYAALGSRYFLVRSIDAGANWSALTISDTIVYRIRSIVSDGPYVVAGIDAPAIVTLRSPSFRSTDAGIAWMLDSGATCQTAQGLGLNDTYIFSSTPWGNSCIRRCNRDSTTWTWLGANSYLYGVEAIWVQDSILIAGQYNQGVSSSSDNGEHWSTILDASMVGVQVAFTHLAVKDSTIFAGTSVDEPVGPHNLKKDGVWRTTNWGASWAKVNNGLPDDNITALVIAGEKVFAATDSGGVFISSNNGDKWYPLNGGLPNPYVHALVANNQYLYAGLYGGVWRMPLNDAVASVGRGEKVVPTKFTLEQNYPNPFNPLTIIKYTVGGVGDQGSGISKVRLVVYDLLGREVAVLVDERKSTGSYEVSFNGSRLASGVYICRFMAGSYVESRKMMLVK